jgi:hypothetical protein
METPETAPQKQPPSTAGGALFLLAMLVLAFFIAFGAGQVLTGWATLIPPGPRL